MNQSSVRLVLANRSSVGLSYLLCPFFLLLSICSHCRSHLGLILKILFVPGRTVFPFSFLPLLTSFSFLSFFRSFLPYYPHFFCCIALLDPFHIFVTLFSFRNVRYPVRVLIFTSLLESSFAFLVSFLCVLLPSFS